MNNSTDDQKSAVALYYVEENAPRVTAKSEGELAQQILELAEQHEVPLERYPKLVAMLAQVPLGDEIPEELYRAVAEVISFAYIIAGKFPAGFQSEG